jgi:anti-sigma regulatory factor (Ser/Thr protein kinase)
LEFGRSAAHVRTARLVAVTVARRGGRPEDLVESVRQGVGEACAIAVRGAAVDDRIEVQIADEGPGLVVWICPVPDAYEPVDDLPRAVLAGLTDAVEAEERGGRPGLRLTWAG